MPPACIYPKSHWAELPTAVKKTRVSSSTSAKLPDLEYLRVNIFDHKSFPAPPLHLEKIFLKQLHIYDYFDSSFLNQKTRAEDQNIQV